MHPKASARLGRRSRQGVAKLTLAAVKATKHGAPKAHSVIRGVECGRQTYLVHSVRLYCRLARSVCAPRDGLKSAGQVLTAIMAARLTRPVPATLILVLIWTVWRIAFLLHTGSPEPSIHDEFSYLLGADTFAHGHLAAPPHALSKFFESPHILVQPTYVKVLPGQALFLASGQILFGSPFFGVLIANVLMLFTFSMMLFVWVLSVGLGVILMFALFLSPRMYWTNSFWGGSVAASGGRLCYLGLGYIAQGKRGSLEPSSPPARAAPVLDKAV